MNAQTVEEDRYLGKIGWSSCIDRYELRARGLPNSKWGYFLLLKDVAEIGIAEDQYQKKHGELPIVLPRQRDRRVLKEKN